MNTYLFFWNQFVETHTTNSLETCRFMLKIMNRMKLDRRNEFKKYTDLFGRDYGGIEDDIAYT